MYKAVHLQSGEEILTLHPGWRKRMAELRALTAKDLLVCQGCRQAVRLKAGSRKRPHFAHQHLQGCSFGQESALVMAGRALMYERLVECCAGFVEAEVNLVDLFRPVDVVLQMSAQNGGSIAYWVVDALMKQETRMRLRSAFQQAGLRPVWILLSNLLRPDPNHPDWIYLSPCERDCLRQTPYDEIGRENHLLADDFGFSLHFLDVEASRLITYRSLERVHAPNVYCGRREECGLDEVQIDPAGDFVYPNEEQDLKSSRVAHRNLAERVDRWLQPSARLKQSTMYQLPLTEIHKEKPEPLGEQVTCIYCGDFTDNWWSAWSEDGERLGKCRDCLEKGYG